MDLEFLITSFTYIYIIYIYLKVIFFILKIGLLIALKNKIYSSQKIENVKSLSIVEIDHTVKGEVI